jgi:cyclophilin family peptidyl-prolyl cis-trans isomerase
MPVPAAVRLLGPIAILSLAACGLPAVTRTSAPPTSPRTGVNLPVSTPLAQPPAEPAGSGLRATIRTSLGDIEIELFDRSAPVATENFVNLARAGFYDGVVFHRLVPGFVIQGGDPEGTGRGGPGYTIRDEPVVGEYARGIVAMARTPQPDSQGSQFFIVLDDEARLSLDQARTYVIFGRVTAGMDVVDRIAAMPNSGEPDNRALRPLAMDRVTISGP